MKTLNYIFFVSMLLCVILNSCSNEQKITLESVEVDSSAYDELDASFDKNDTMKSLIGKGSTWRTWLKLHKECMNAEWLNKPYYFGVSNTVNLGSIVDKKYGLQRTMDSTNGFSENELKSIINYGNFSSCGYTQEMTMSLDIFLQSEFDFTQTGTADLNAELQLAIAKSKNTKVKIDNWRVNNIKEDNLLDALYDAPSSDTKKKKFLETLKKDNHYILVKVIEIKGFSSYIELERDMSAGLEAKLKEGVVANMGNAGVQAKFSYKDKRTIEVKSGDNFYVFGQFKQAKKIME